MLWWRSRNWHHHRAHLSQSRTALVTQCFTALCVTVLVSACASSNSRIQVHRESDTKLSPVTAKVIDVIDGDTIEIRINGRNETVRLIGIDTPETVHPTKPVQCYGPEASAYLSTVLPKGTLIDVTRDVEARDYFGRLLLYVHRHIDNLFVNLHLVETGHATALPYAPNTSLSTQFARAAQQAHTAKLGLWRACSR